MSNIGSNLKKLLRGERACFPEEFLKVPAYNSPTLRTGKGRPISQGQFGKMYRGSINDNGRRYVAYKEIDTSESIDGAFEFEFKVAQKLKEFAVPEMYLFKKCPIQDKTPKKVRKENGTLVLPVKRTKPKDILYMELLDGMSFDSWWQTDPSLDAIKSVIIQVFDNLYRINQKYPNFRHRDLHGKNVMVNPNALKTEYTWEVNLGPEEIKKYERTNAGVEATIIDFGLSYWSERMPNPETADGGYEHAGIYENRPGTIRYDTHRFLYIIYVKVRQPQNAKERAIKNFIEELIPNKKYLEFNGPFTSQGYLVKDYWAMQEIPSFKTILSHPFLTGEKTPNRPKTLANALEMIPKAKTPPKVKTPVKAKTKTPSPKLSTAERKKKMNNAIKKAAAVLAANKNKTKPPLRRPGVARPNPVPEIKTATPNAPYGEMSPSNIMNLARKVDSGRKKAANKLNAKLKEIKATKGKTPTPVRLKQRYTFVDVNGKKREYVRKFAYDRALAKNKAEREKRAQPTWSEKARMKRYERGQPFNMKTPQNVRNAIQAGKNMKFVGGRFKTATPKAETPGYKFTNILGKERVFKSKASYEKALAKNKAKREETTAKAKINQYVNTLSNEEREILKKKIC